MARPGEERCTQSVCLHSAGLVLPTLSVVVLEGHGQQEVWPHCGWKEPTPQGRQVLLGQE